MTRVRKDVRSLGAGWNDTLLWYAKAVGTLQSRPVTNPTSWRFMAAIHGMHPTVWRQFGITSARIGTVAGAGGTQRLVRLIGPEWTKELLFSGEFIDAETALRIRLVSEVLPPERVLPRALERLECYARRAPLSIAYAKAAVNDGAEMPLAYALAYERQLTTTLFTTEDRKEGQRAFLEKRPPGFKGE